MEQDEIDRFGRIIAKGAKRAEYRKPPTAAQAAIDRAIALLDDYVNFPNDPDGLPYSVVAAVWRDLHVAQKDLNK